MTQDDVLVVKVGSEDWNGGEAPPFPGGHTGTATIVMQDGTKFVVASNRSEVLRKLDAHAVAATNPTWVAFDMPSSAIPVVLNISNIQSVL